MDLNTTRALARGGSQPRRRTSPHPRAGPRSPAPRHSPSATSCPSQVRFAGERGSMDAAGPCRLGRRVFESSS